MCVWVTNKWNKRQSFPNRESPSLSLTSFSLQQGKYTYHDAPRSTDTDLWFTWFIQLGIELLLNVFECFTNLINRTFDGILKMYKCLWIKLWFTLPCDTLNFILSPWMNMYGCNACYNKILIVIKCFKSLICMLEAIVIFRLLYIC